MARPRGGAYLLIVRVVSVLASLLFSFLLITTLLMPLNLEFIPPGQAEAGFRFEDGTLFIETNFTIGNNGYHDITDFTFHVEGVVEGNVSIANYTTAPLDIPIGNRSVVSISVPVDLETLQDSSYLIFEPANITFTMGINATTTRGLLDFGGSFTFEQEFEALIPEFNLDFNNSLPDPLAGEWVVPYSVGTASFLSGNATATVSIANETGSLLTETNETFVLGQPQMGNLTFSLDPATALDLLAGPQDLTVQVALEMPGDLTFTFETVVSYDPGGP